MYEGGRILADEVLTKLMDRRHASYPVASGFTSTTFASDLLTFKKYGKRWIREKSLLPLCLKSFLSPVVVLQA